MAEYTEKNPLNSSGKYYNDLSCIDCGMCPDIAPTLFTRDNDEGLSYVFKQPETEEEMQLAEEALESCPTESIGRNGEESSTLTL